MAYLCRLALVFVGNIWRKAPEIKNRPIEFTIVTKKVETTKLPQGQKSQNNYNSGNSGISSGSDNRKLNKLQTAASANGQNSPQQRVHRLNNSLQQPLQPTKPLEPVTKITQQKVPQTQPHVLQNLPRQNLIDTIEQRPQEQALTKPVNTKAPKLVDARIPPVQKEPIEKHLQTETLAQSVQRVKPNQSNSSLIHKLIEQRNISSHTETFKVFTPAPSTSITTNTYPPQEAQGLEELNTNVAKSTGNNVGDGNGGHSNGVGNGNGGHGNDVGNGSSGHGNGAGNGHENEVATDPKPSIATNSRLNPADCDRCIIEYPDSARRRHIEGSPEVAIDHDENGRVTNVQLIRSSGSVELDET